MRRRTLATGTLMHTMRFAWYTTTGGLGGNPSVTGGGPRSEEKRKFSEFSMSRGIPADASGAYRPGPQATTESLPGIFPPIFLIYPPVTEGLRLEVVFS